MLLGLPRRTLCRTKSLFDSQVLDWTPPSHDRDDPPALLMDDDDKEDPEVEDGDRLFAAGLYHPTVPTAEIWATSTILQRLAEAFKQNSEPTVGVLDYLREFDYVFSKESFNVLPESKP
jgi:hypothetical protein